jgi:Uma2 family endonuclease
MATGTLVSVEEYLSTSYRPDCEYIDGVVLERNLGEYDHGRLQLAIGAYFYNRRNEWNVFVVTEQRVQVKPKRFRVPDVCVGLGPGPAEQILRTPPFICIEILSRKDTVDRLQERIDDYLAFGVRYVWVINPRTRRAWAYTDAGLGEVKDGILRTENPDLVVPLAELFD